MHHIIQEADGGSNDLDNAIALCFDCHADAGHYNPKHPRGTKFSPSELRRHRDNWHHTVRHHKITATPDPELLYCRYLLCRSFEAFREITTGELSDVPVDQPLLISNDVRAFQRTVVTAHPDTYRHDHVWGDSFQDRHSYSNAHPAVRLIERSSINMYPYFEGFRRPTREELVERVAPSDSITRFLLNGDAPISEISFVLAYNEFCGDSGFQEIYRVRPAWPLYLAATNITDKPLSLRGLVGEQELPEGIGFRPFFKRQSHKSFVQALPHAALPPGATLLAPLATLLGPLGNISDEVLSDSSQYLPSGQGQVLAQENLEGALDSTALIGPAFWPQTIRLELDGMSREQSMHEFDLKNLYTISRFWEAGSCPHLFAQYTSEVKYLGELFSRSPGASEYHHVDVPLGSNALIVAELEPELAVIQSIRVNGELKIEGTELGQGETLLVRAASGDDVEFVGYYLAGFSGHLGPWQKNHLIAEFMRLLSAAADDRRPHV